MQEGGLGCQAQALAATLGEVDGHFWDWALWLRSKLAAGRRDLVAGELRKLHEQLLSQMGVICAPPSLSEAVIAYREAATNANAVWERTYRGTPNTP